MEKISKKYMALGWAAALALLVMAALELVAWCLTGYLPLLLLGAVQLLPALLNLAVLLPFGGDKKPKAPKKSKKAPQEEQPDPTVPLVEQQVGKIIDGAAAGTASLWKRWRKWLVPGLMAAAAVAVNWVFWTGISTQAPHVKMNYFTPVVIAALFVISVVVEKWCTHTADKENCPKFVAAVLRNVRGAMALGRLAQILTAAAIVLNLVGLYDLCQIVKIPLGVLFLYETGMLVLSGAIRIIRRELTQEPALPLTPKAAGSSGLLAYLEENTGITMRSLWSMELIRQLLPLAVVSCALLLWLTTGVVQIDAHQNGALYRCGRLEKILKPGIHLTLPWPFDNVEVYDTQTVHQASVGYVSSGSQDNIWTEAHGGEEYRLLSGGGNEMVSINLVLEYRISDLRAYLTGSASAESLMQAAAYEIVTARTITSDIDALLAADRAAFSESFRTELVERLAVYDTGLEITNVVLESIHPPVEVADVYQRIVSAEIRAWEIILEAQMEAQMQVTSATASSDAKVSIAQTSYIQETAAAHGAVSEFVASLQAENAYGSAYRYYKYINALTQAYNKGTLMIVSDGVDAGNLIIGDLEIYNPEDDYYIEDEGGE